MLINHDTRCALDCVVDLINTAPESEGNEDLSDLAALRDFVKRNRVSDVGPLGESDLAAVRAVRDRFAEVFSSRGDRAAAELINTLIAEAGTTPRLTDHDSYAWHVHYFAPGAAPDCHRAFVDLSRNRSRRYCSSRTCGNRLHVAAYRARQREAAS
ncbi:MAG: CGNR zinc finger domain-containing protein [Streptomycetaceae bacterium]|nr:CGNR zinc finger domain-containing protein [Streptomycetaceae bacterium]